MPLSRLATDGLRSTNQRCQEAMVGLWTSGISKEEVQVDLRVS